MKDKLPHRTYRKRALFQITKVLWHLDIFRRSFRELSGHSCMAESCIFCALKELFSQLQSSHESALPPDALRRALAESFFDEQRFQLGFMDDAAECFENMLLRIHYHIASEQAEDMCNAKHCIPHEKFAMTLVEQSVCGACGATSEPLPFTQMVHYVSASALTAQARQSLSPSHPDLFGQLLKKAGGMGDIRDCPSACGAKIQIRRTLMNRPEIVSVGVVWDSDRPSLEHIMAVLGTLRTSLRLSDVFHGCDNSAISTPLHQLVGVVTYYGKHYSTFFFHTKLKVWIYFDDATVREIGPRWEQVVEKCRRGRYQPLLLLFAVPEGTSIDTSNAPKSVTMATRAPLVNSGKSLQLQKTSTTPIVGGRRSLTPSPEKPSSLGTLNQRRAVTPNPEQTNQEYIRAKTALMQTNEYQNLSHIQASIFNQTGPINQAVSSNNSSPNLDYSLSNRKLANPERLQIQRRDSGNWSGDRNSASSSSSTSLENPYQYIVGKMQLRAHNGGGGVPRSPTSIKPGELSSSSTGSNHGDAGYDSYSLSSTDSLPLQNLLKHNLQLAQIPEGHQTPTNLNSVQYSTQLLNQSAVDDCERLCAEADKLLGRSEEAEDLITALSYCNAAAGKARAAMDAPYSNPQTASFARMKHNTCIMRARSLHRKLEEPLQTSRHSEGRHSREGSGCSEGRRSAGSHSRQNSKDKTNVSHSRQNSKELLTSTPTKLTQSTNHLLQQTQDEKPTEKQHKNIEIYATLPKNKKGILSSKNKPAKNVIEDEEYLNYERPGRNLLLNRNKSKKDIEKRAKSEEKSNKKDKDFLSSLIKDKDKEKEKENKKAEKEKNAEKKAEEKQGKKQHKIRRKLLMGGLIRRKNRSMPDLRDDEQLETKPVKEPKQISKDDILLNKQTEKNLSGYLSEGHLEFSGNPNLQRSKLMRKSFYGSKMIAAKVPPPPPLRTTSQLTKLEMAKNQYEPQSLQYNKTDSVTYANGGILLPECQSHTVNTLTVEAQIHHENSKNSSPSKEDVDVVDGMIINKIEEPVTALPLPPYPSPHGSVAHSRQASEDFPPPPSLDMEVKSPETFLEQLQFRKQQMLNNPDHQTRKQHQNFGRGVDQVDYRFQDNQQRQIISESELNKKQQNQQQIYQQQNQILTEAEHLRKQQMNGTDVPDSMRKNSVSQMNYMPQQQINYSAQTHQNNSNYNQSHPQHITSQNNYNAHYNLQQLTTQTHGQVVYPQQNAYPSEQILPYNNQLDHHSHSQMLNIESEKIRKQLLLAETIEKEVDEAVEVTRAIGGETWLKELQAKQALLKNKRNSSSSIDSLAENTNVVKDLKSKFEQSLKLTKDASDTVRASPSQVSDCGSDSVDGCIKRRNSMEKELKPIIDSNKVKSGKKKNVTFCEQVVLVATAEENEDDCYIPNPILERVLRSVLSKDQTDSILPFREVTRETVVPLKRTDSMKSYTQGLPLTATQEINIDDTQKRKPESTQNPPHQEPRISQSQDSSRLGQSGPHLDSIRNSQASHAQESIRLTQQSPVFNRPLTIPPHPQISTPLSSSPSNASAHHPSPNSSLLRNPNTNSLSTRLQQNSAYNQVPSAINTLTQTNHSNSSSNHNSPNYNTHNRSYSPQNGGFSTSPSMTQMASNPPQRSPSTSTHLPYAQHLQNSTRGQFQTKAVQQQAMAADNVKHPQSHFPNNGNLGNPNSSQSHSNSPCNTLTHSNSSSSLNSNNSNSSYSGSNPNFASQTNNGYLPAHLNSQITGINGYHPYSQNQNGYSLAPGNANSSSNQPSNNQNNYRLTAQNGYDHSPYQPIPQPTGQINQNGFKPMTSQPNEGRPNGPYQSVPTQNVYHSQSSTYQTTPALNGHNTGSLNSKIKQSLRPNPSVYQQNALKNQRPQGVYQQDLALPEYNPPPPAPGSQRSSDSPYQKVPVSENIYPPYQKVPNQHEISQQRTSNASRQDIYQRVPNPQDPYQRIPESPRGLNDPYQRVPHPQDLSNQRGTPSSQDQYQRVANPNVQEPYQRLPLDSNQRPSQDPYQRVPDPNGSYQRIPNASDPNSNYQRIPNSSEQNSSYTRLQNISDSSVYQRLPPTSNPNDPYQRVPNPIELPNRVPNTNLPDPSGFPNKYSPYQHPPAPRNVSDKCMIRTSSSNVCNLCRKKSISHPAVYCTDCDFYMSRFKPKTGTSA